MKNFVILTLVVVFQVIGNLLLSHGMRTVGEIDHLSGPALLAYGLKTASNPYVLFGVALLIAFFAMYLTALSRLELSYVLPMTASTYVLTALLAWLVLGESVSIQRWLGTITVSIGIIIVGEGERRKRASESQVICQAEQAADVNEVTL